MDAQTLKTALIGVLGETLMAKVQGIRFAYINVKYPLPDPEVQLLPRFIQGGDVAIDVGANGANWTLALHRSVGRKGRVFAYEADPYYARATNVAIWLMRMKGVRLFPFGLSDRDEEVPLRVVDESNRRVSGLGYIDRDAKRNQKEVTVVRLRSLDSMIREYPELLRTALLKCDVEGYELFVFRGAEQLIARARPVVVLEVGNYEKQGYSARDVYDFFKVREYEAFAMVAGGGLAPTDVELDHAKVLSVNRVLVPAEKVVSVRDLLQ